MSSFFTDYEIESIIFLSTLIRRHSIPLYPISNMGLHQSICMDEACYGDYERRKPSKTLVPVLSPSKIISMKENEKKSDEEEEEIETVIFADFSDPYIHKTAVDLGAYSDDEREEEQIDMVDESKLTQEKHISNTDIITPINTNLKVKSLEVNLEENIKSSIAVVTPTELKGQETNQLSVNIDFPELVDNEESHMISGKFEIHPLLVQSPNVSREGLPSSTNKETQLYDPMEKASDVLLKAIETSNYDEVQVLHREFRWPIAYLKFKDNRSPLHVAVQNKDFNMVQLLLNLGADTSVENSDGCTPIQVAHELQAYDIVEILLSYEPSVQLSPSSNTQTNTISSQPQSSIQEDSDHPPQTRYGFQLRDMIISLDRQESYVSQLTSSMGSPSQTILPILSTAGGDMNPSGHYHLDSRNLVRHHEVVHVQRNKPRGINRTIRKAASRMMSFVQPSQYPKSKRGHSNRLTGRLR